MMIRLRGGFANARRADKDLDADRRLAERIVSGDEAAFEEFVAQHYGRVARIAGRFFRRGEIAEEIHQEVFVKAYTAMAGYRAEMPLEHWVSRIAVNACYDQLRRARRRPETPVSQLCDDSGDLFERLAAQSAAVDGFWRREDARLCAEQILDLLAPAERLVLTLMVLEDLTASEVAAVTGWSVANVKVRAFRARGRLRKLLASRAAGVRKG